MSDRIKKSVEAHLNRRTDAALERYGLLREDFQNAHDNVRSPEQEQASGNAGRESQMVAKDQPTLQPRPPEEIARPVDRESFNDRWREEQQNAHQDRDRGDENER